MLEIREYTPDYKESVRRICIATGSEKGRTDPVYADYACTLYCDEYADHEVVYLLMDEDKAVGYILCAEDADVYAENMKPYLDHLRELGEHYIMMGEMENRMYQELKQDYPAHMHIDVMEDYTHGGHGTALFNTLIRRLEQDHVKGLNLCVASANERAVKFYKKMGFEVLQDLGQALVMGYKVL